jgi:hypothetical protein
MAVLVVVSPIDRFAALLAVPPPPRTWWRWRAALCLCVVSAMQLWTSGVIQVDYLGANQLST